MKTKLVLTGILKDHDKLLAVRRALDDDLFAGAWEFPGGHIEEGETIKEGLARELKEEIGFKGDFEPRIVNYTDEVKTKNGELVHNVELDFVIEVDSKKVKVKLSNEHCEFAWVTKDSELFDEYIQAKLTNI
ncbi:MAG: NUDIX domain-containing protein [Bacilli bacterium]|nr:NUDIX domain-containing protein [Bacilli bacterium]